MPIRMVPDENKGQEQQPHNPRRNQGGSGGGLGGLLSFLPAILGFLFKRPKFLLLILIIGGAWYMFGDGCMGNMTPTDPGQDNSGLLKGADLDEKEYDKAEVYEPLAEVSSNTLPESISLKKYCPDIKNQGYQGSCVGWSSSYAARTILQARATGQNPNSVAFSPSSLYNQIALRDCQGAYINEAMDVMKQRGVLPYRDFPYNENSCSTKPRDPKMAQYRTKGYNRLSKGVGTGGEVNIRAIKENLAQGAPVVIGMLVGGSFMQQMQGKEVWRPSRSDMQMRGFGGHAMCVIGYDDYKEGGAFQIMNSWGKEWGIGGYGWVRYNDFQYFTKEAYGLYPMGSADKRNAHKFEMAFGLITTKGGQTIPIKQVRGNYFETVGSIPKMTPFKIQVNNTIECYTYVFGSEVDGRSYRLFPYTTKHSPYCGITGTRIFPRTESLQPDAVGNKDYFAILVTKQAVEYDNINKAINRQAGTDYISKVNGALNPYVKKNVTFQGDGKNIGFITETAGDEGIVMIIGVNKQ